MKKRLAYGLLLLLACACSRVEQPAPPRAEVAFATPAVGAASKAVTGELGATYDIHEDFLVWSWFSPADLTRADGTTDGSTPNGASYFEKVRAYHTGSSLAHTDYWRLTPVQYWPMGSGRLSFHALSPAEVDTYCTSSGHVWGEGFTLTGFQVKDAPKEQIDLLYSDYVFNRQRSQYDDGTPYDDPQTTPGEIADEAPYIYNGVNLTFNHALASVHFKVKEDRDYELVGGRIRLFLRKLEVLHPYSTGNFSENRRADGVTNAYASGDGPVWSGQAAEKDYTLYEKGSLTVGGATPAGDIPMLTNGTWYVARGVTVTKGVEIVFRKNNNFDDRVLGHIRGTLPYERGKEFPVTDVNASDINILDGGTYDILLNPGEKIARIVDAQPDSYYTAFDMTGEWGVHFTTGFKLSTNAVDLTQQDAYGNYYIGGQSLLMIPQPLAHTGTGNKVQVRITFCVKVADVEKEVVVTKDLDITSFEAWLPGRRYIYTLTIGMDQVRLTPSVEAWKDIINIGIES